MLSINHTLIGASAGKIIGNPIIAFLTGILLHFIFDKVPHYWPNNKKSQDRIIFLDATISTIILILLCYYQYSFGTILGAVGGLIVDTSLVLIKKFRNSKIGLWHTQRQPHKTNRIYLLVDIIIILLNILFLAL